MTLNEATLQKLADWRPGARQTLHIAEEGTPWQVFLTGDSGDAFSCRVWELNLVRNGGAGLIPLKPWADLVCRKATGLLETLTLLEVDEIRREALIRSGEPSNKADKLAYYEVVLKAQGDATVRRYQAFREGPAHRDQVAFTLTHEVLAKLTGDLIPED